MDVKTSHLTDNTGSGSSINTASISPSPNQLVLVYVATFNSGGTPNTPTLTGCNMTWVAVATATTTQRKVTVFRGMSDNPTAGALTISYAGQSNSVGWSVDQFANVNTTGTNGSGAVVQSNVNQSTSVNGNFAVSLNPFASVNNATYGGEQQSANNATTGSSFTTIVNNNTNRVVEWANNNQTSVNWNVGVNNVLACAVALEIAYQPPMGGAFLYNML
jgi:hypothetical protein